MSLNIVSLICGILGTAWFAVVLSGAWSRGLRAAILSTCDFVLVAPFRFALDLGSARQRSKAGPRKWPSAAAARGWIVPIVLGGIFAVLFASANPLIELWLSALDPFRWNFHIDVERVILWATAIVLAWPFLAIQFRQWGAVGVTATAAEPPTVGEANGVFGDKAILRSLVLFNVLFAVETVLDGLYLWGGVALPDGMTYATYAHRGAYPLIVTALLSAAFVLAAMRPGGTGERSPAMRILVFAWIGQNVLLVVSSILRLDLYVATYSLTMLRVAAFIWMFLVVIGLLLIVVRIALRRSNQWLIGANLVALALTLYCCCFVNFSYEISRYNFAHSSDRLPGGLPFDITYAFELGPQAIPTIDLLIAARALPASSPWVISRNQMADAHGRRMPDWRAWTFRNWRLERYLQEQADARGVASR